MIDFGKCECGGKLIPIYNEWKDGDKIIRGIDVLRCECPDTFKFLMLMNRWHDCQNRTATDNVSSKYCQYAEKTEDFQ